MFFHGGIAAGYELLAGDLVHDLAWKDFLRRNSQVVLLKGSDDGISCNLGTAPLFATPYR